MALPVFRAAGTKTTGTTTATAVSAPAGVATGDLEILIAVTIAGGTVTLSSAGGSAWTTMTGTPVDVSLGARMYVWWRIRQAGDSDPQVAAGSDHFCAGRLCYQAGTFDSSSPFENIVTGTEVGSDTSFSFAPGGNTSGADRLVCCIASSGFDSNSQQVPVMTNASLTALNARMNNHNTTTGGGGGFGMTEGARAAAGSVGTFACTYATSSTKGYVSFAIKPVPAPSQTSVARISLAAGNTPTTRTAHSIKVRARVSSGTGTLKAALYESTNNRSGDLESAALTSSLAEYTLAISDANAANITSYADLEIRFWGYVASPGGASVFEVDQIWLETPAGVAFTPISLAGGITFTPALTKVKSAPRALVGAVTFALAVLKLVTRAQAVTVTLTGAVVAQRKSSLAEVGTVTLTPTIASQQKRIRQFDLTATLTAALTRFVQYFRTEAVTATFTPAVARQVFAKRALDVPVNFTGALVRLLQHKRASDVVVTLTPTIAPFKQLPRQFNVTVTLTAVVTRVVKYFRTEAVTATLTPTMDRRSLSKRALDVPVNFTTAMLKAAKKYYVLPVTVTFTPTVTAQRKFFKPVDVTVTFTPTLARFIKYFRTHAVTTTFTLVMDRRVFGFRLLAVPVNFTVNMVNGIKKYYTLPVTVTFTPTLAQAGQLFIRALNGSVNFTVTMVRLPGRVLAQALTLTPTFARRLLMKRSADAVLNSNPALSRKLLLSKPQAGVITFTPEISVLGQIEHTLAASLTFTAAMGKRVVYTLVAPILFTPASMRKLARAWNLPITVTPVISTTQAQERSFSGVLTLVGGLTQVKSRFRPIVASVSLTAALTRLVGFRRTVDLQVTSGLQMAAKATRFRRFDYNLTFGTEMRRFFRRDMPLGVGFNAALQIFSGFINVTFAVVVNFTVGFALRLFGIGGKLLSATLGIARLLSAKANSVMLSAKTKLQR